MVKSASIVAAALLAATAVSAAAVPAQTPLQLNRVKHPKQPQTQERKLHGRFLHITDIHPDSHYKPGTDPSYQCHRGTGTAGRYGAEKSSCDTPWTLVDETFRWIEENLKDQIDFVVWTGDSARHDKDVKIPRTEAEIYNSNEKTVGKMLEVFGNSMDEERPLTLPIVPTVGNNDIYPHNIMQPGPSQLTKEYLELWKPFIPEDQYHVFYKGAYFWQQVVPGENGKLGPASEGGLVVFSLNTMYFFNSNTAVDGCNAPSEPGYEQMEWLNVQLALMREQGMKAILIGHVPPVWTDTKMSWDESCWKKYVLWSRQYRDVIVGHLYGHMNLDHFTLLDSEQLKPPHLNPKKGKKSKKGHKSDSNHFSFLPSDRSLLDTCKPQEFNPEEDPYLTVSSAESYLNSLREAFAQMVSPLGANDSNLVSNEKSLGGKWAERYVLTHVSPSVVPNYFPTLRVMEYNITGLVDTQGMLKLESLSQEKLSEEEKIQVLKKKKNKISMPEGPSKTAPPGPAYSMQPYTFIGYTQYFLNLTKYNTLGTSQFDGMNNKRTEATTGKGRSPKLQYEVEYDTRTDKVYKLKDLTVRSYIRLAQAIVDASPNKKSASTSPNNEDSDGDWDAEKLVDNDGGVTEPRKKKKKNHREKKARDKVWHAFVKRAFVSTVDGKELKQFEAKRAECAPEEEREEYEL